MIQTKIGKTRLYFQVMMQAHNRHNSMSFYLAAIATVDTVALTVGECI